VPLFIADGYHTQEDIPEDMGLTEDYRLGWDVPSEVDGHRIWYTGAVGTEDLLADVLLERAADAGADIGDAREAVRELPPRRSQGPRPIPDPNRTPERARGLDA